MKRRREIGPKRQKNRPALIKFMIWALVAAVAGSALTYLCYKFLGYTPASPDTENGVSLLTRVPAMLFATTIITVLALLFFGVRAYLIGVKARFTLQSRRMKIKRS